MSSSLLPPHATILTKHQTSLEVRVDAPDCGWIRIHIPALLDDDPVRCTHILDPFRNFVRWLEAIAARTASSVWQVPEEGSTRHLVFLGACRDLGDDAAQLIVSSTADRVFALAACTIGRRTVVEAFYTAFIRMI